VRSKDPLVLPNANSKFRGQPSPAENTAIDQRLFQARWLEWEDSIGGSNGPFERRVADFRRGAGASPALCDLREHSLERAAAKRNFDPNRKPEHFDQRAYEPYTVSIDENHAPPSIDADAR
jgi:hypothetical protein